jgi:hypothetical protein
VLPIVIGIARHQCCPSSLILPIANDAHIVVAVLPIVSIAHRYQYCPSSSSLLPIIIIAHRQ